MGYECKFHEKAILGQPPRNTLLKSHDVKEILLENYITVWVLNGPKNG